MGNGTRHGTLEEGVEVRRHDRAQHAFLVQGRDRPMRRVRGEAVENAQESKPRRAGEGVVDDLTELGQIERVEA